MNLFAGPGAGKSTTAAGVFCNLKKKGVNCELVTEFAKELTWENRALALDNQIYILGKQYHRFHRVVEQVDVVITDTSFLYGSVYAPKDYFPSFNQLVLEIFNSMDNRNYWLDRKKVYDPVGRNQTEEEAHVIDRKIRNTLDISGVLYNTVPGDDTGIDTITKDVLDILVTRLLSNV